MTTTDFKAKKFTSIPEHVEAVLLTKDNLIDVAIWCGGSTHSEVVHGQKVQYMSYPSEVEPGGFSSNYREINLGSWLVCRVDTVTHVKKYYAESQAGMERKFQEDKAPFGEGEGLFE